MSEMDKVLDLFGGRDEEKTSEALDVTSGGIFIEPAFPKEEALSSDADEVIEGAICIIQNLMNTISTIKKYESELQGQRNKCQAIVDQLSASIALTLDGDDWKSGDHAVGYRSSEQLEVIDESLIPDEFMKIPAPTPDKAAIKKAIKAGQEVPGAVIKKNKNIQLK